MTQLLYFIRHGETDWNAEARFQGKRDIPLNDKGRKQAFLNGKTLKSLLKGKDLPFISSPLARTRETMEIIRETMGLERMGYTTDARLQELSFGAWEGLSVDELQQAHPALWAQRQMDKWFFRPPAGESYHDLTLRLKSWVRELPSHAVIVAHGGVNRGLRSLLCDGDKETLASAAIPQDKVMMIQNGRVAWV